MVIQYLFKYLGNNNRQIDNKHQMAKSTLSLMLVIACLTISAMCQDSVVVITSNNADNSILDSDTLLEHLKNNEQIKKYIVDTSVLDEQALKVAKKVLQNANVQQDTVNSFILSAHQLKKSIEPIISQIEEVSVSQLAHLLEKTSQSVIYFTKKSKHTRLLAQTQATTMTPSNLFINMTPAVLSGLFVAIFLIVIIIIGISCLYGIKTNDKFATSNLFVGRQS